VLQQGTATNKGSAALAFSILNGCRNFPDSRAIPRTFQFNITRSAWNWSVRMQFESLKVVSGQNGGPERQRQCRSSQKILGGAEDTLKNIRLLNSHYNAFIVPRLLNSHYNAFIVLGRLWTSTSFCRLNNHREPACSSQHYRQAR